MPSSDSFQYDVFISYSQQDRNWVEANLLFRLETAGMNVGIDFRHFELGASELDEFERMANHSRKTLLVLTNAYINNELKLYEWLISERVAVFRAQARLIPIMIEKCEIPERLKMRVGVDLSETARSEEEWTRLMKFLIHAKHNDLERAADMTEQAIVERVAEIMKEVREFCFLGDLDKAQAHLQRVRLEDPNGRAAVLEPELDGLRAIVWDLYEQKIEKILQNAKMRLQIAATEKEWMEIFDLLEQVDLARVPLEHKRRIEKRCNSLLAQLKQGLINLRPAR